MTNIQKIKQAREEMDTAFSVAFKRASRVKSDLRVRLIDMEVLQSSVHKLMALQAEALRQATEVADENFARAQKLSEQVQENVRHIERLAERRRDEDKRITEGLESIAMRINAFVESERAMPIDSLRMCQDKIAMVMALAKGEAV